MDSSLNIFKPDYSRAIFNVIPTILWENFCQELEEPYNNFIFSLKEYLTHFKPSDLTILFIVDSLGVSAPYDFLNNQWISSGKLELSSVVPSTTANAVGSIYLGLPPELSGLVSMRFYASSIDRFVNSLYTLTIEDDPKKLKEYGVSPEDLLWNKSVLSQLDFDEIKVVELLPNFIRGGLKLFYDKYLASIKYETTIDAFFVVEHLIKHFAGKGEKALIIVYLHHLDSLAHKYGYKSREWNAQLDMLNKFFEGFVLKAEKIVENRGLEITGYVVSDHGQINPKIVKEFDRDEVGAVLNALGVEQFLNSDRFASFYLKKEYLDKIHTVKENLQDIFIDIGVIVTIGEAIKLGLWPALEKGNIERFIERIGHLVLIPRNNAAFELKGNNDSNEGEIYKSYKRELLLELGLDRPIGRHGGLTKEEMRTPFIPLF